MRVKDYLKLLLYGNVKVGEIQKAGWSAPIDTYLFKCPVHGYVINHVKGHNQRLECPHCLLHQIEHL